MRFCILLLLWTSTCAGQIFGQDAAADKVELGSRTARKGFQNEDEIRDKFNRWQSDEDAVAWLTAMGYDANMIEAVSAEKPHGEKADVEVSVKTVSGQKTERISIKLVSSSNGFNQIDKRWLAAYAEMWAMPPHVVQALKLFVGELPPLQDARNEERMYLNELNEDVQAQVLQFFSAHKDDIISDLLAGDGPHAANWMMVTLKDGPQTRWVIRSMKDAIRCFGQGEVQLTRAGNLKIGQISMQRKGGDNGRETAKMLQFKVNPVLLFAAK